MMSDFLDHLADKVRLVGNDEKCRFLEFLIKHVQHLRRSILVNDGIQCFIPSKENTCSSKNISFCGSNFIGNPPVWIDLYINFSIRNPMCIVKGDFEVFKRF